MHPLMQALNRAFFLLFFIIGSIPERRLMIDQNRDIDIETMLK